MKTNQNPHDSLFKATFTDKQIATDYIKNFLPPDIVRNLNLDSLNLEPGSYITPELEPYYSDIIYRCYYGKEEIVLTLLFEHKSTPPKYPHLQLLRYMLEGWERGVNRNNKLFPMLPIIVYHGKKKWKRRKFQDYFGNLDSSIAPYIPDFEYHLTDLTEWSDEGLLALKAGLLINTFLLFKHYGEEEYIRNSINTLFTSTEGYIEEEHKRNQIISFFVYLWKTSDFDSKELKLLISQLPKPVNNVTMTTYQRILEEGRIKGLQEGKLEGKLEGKREGKREGKIEKENLVISNAFLVGLDNEMIAKLTGLSTEEVQKRIKGLGLRK